MKTPDRGRVALLGRWRRSADTAPGRHNLHVIRVKQESRRRTSDPMALLPGASTRGGRRSRMRHRAGVGGYRQVSAAIPTIRHGIRMKCSAAPFASILALRSEGKTRAIVGKRRISGDGSDVGRGRAQVADDRLDHPETRPSGRSSWRRSGVACSARCSALAELTGTCSHRHTPFNSEKPPRIAGEFLHVALAASSGGRCRRCTPATPG